MTKALQGLVLHPDVMPNKTVHMPSQDALVNIGTGFFINGLYLIVMGSSTAQDYQATSANFHLRRGVVMYVKSSCTMCGHNNCYSTTCVGEEAYPTNIERMRRCERAGLDVSGDVFCGTVGGMVLK